MPLQLEIDRDALAALCRKHGIRKLWVFGSAVREDFGPGSDVDLLYTFEPGHRVGWEIIEIEREMSELLGRNVDLVPEKFLKPQVRRQVEKQRVALFEAAEPVYV